MSLNRQVLDFFPRPRLMPLARASLRLQNALWKNWGHMLSGRIKFQVFPESRSSPSVLRAHLSKCVLSRLTLLLSLLWFINMRICLVFQNAGFTNTIARKKAGGLGLDVYIFSYNQICPAYHGHVGNSMRLLNWHKYFKSGHLRIPH